MKKILFIVTQSEFGGAQRYIFDLATSLKNQFQIIVAAGPPAAKLWQAGKNPTGELFKRLQSNNIQCHYIKNLKRAINPIYDLFAFFEIKRLIKKEKPHIIHLNSTKAGILGSLAAPKNIRPRPKIIYTAHGWVFNEDSIWPKRKLFLFLEKLTSKFKHKIICVSSFDYETAIKNKFPAEKLSVIHNGINSDNLSFLPKEEARQKLLDKINASFRLRNSNFKIIGAISNLYPTKGIKYLVETAKNIAKHPAIDANLIFLVIGEGQERINLENLIKKYNLENIFFLAGHMPNAFQYITAFDVFVMSSTKEGLPYAILEAMAGGAPIVAASAGGIPEAIINNKAGFIVRLKNSLDLAEKIRRVLNNNAEAQKMGEAAEKRVKQKFSLNRMIEKTKETYLS